MRIEELERMLPPLLAVGGSGLSHARILLFAFMIVDCTALVRSEELAPVQRVYLSCHASPWISEPADDPDHTKWETWPGRTAQLRPQDFEIRRRYYELMRRADNDDALFIIPSYPPDSRPATEVQLIADGRKHFGDRCVVTSESLPPAESLGPDFLRGLERDRALAQSARHKSVADEAFQHEFEAWIRAKSWITDLVRKLESNGYTFDPKTVEFICWGADFRGCAATYPMMMGRALNLANPIERRWDMIVHDEGRMVAESCLVLQNVHLPDNVRLYIARNKQGRYYADFWEGIHGPMDRARQIALKFPPHSVRLVNCHGEATDGASYGDLSVGIGCGGHTPHRETILEARDGLPLDVFYTCLVAGDIVEKP